MQLSSSERARPLNFILQSGVRFAPFLTRRACVSHWNGCRSGRHVPPLRPVIPDLTANPGQKIIVDTTFHQRVAKTAMGRRIGHRRKEIEIAKQHEIQPQLRARACVSANTTASPLVHQTTPERLPSAYRVDGLSGII